MKTANFLGQECCVLENNTLKLLVTRSVGPRILSLQFQGRENMFAELPDFVTDCPGSGTFHFYGGHRLWHAPEEPSRTYLPDDSPVHVDEIENGLQVTQDTEPKTGLQKSMEIRLLGQAQVMIDHHFTNRGLWDVTCAPWALTQFKPGGLAILPQIRTDTGVLPNRSLTLWPYTDMTSPRVKWGSNYIMVDVNVDSPFKIGFPNPRGWLAYWLNGTLFVKRAQYQPEADYYDWRCSSEFYCNDQFIELESLAPITRIAPHATITHTEIWNVYDEKDCPRAESDVQRIIDKLGLE